MYNKLLINVVFSFPVAPTLIKLKGQGRENTLEVKEGSEVTLECSVHNSKPVASITWLKNDQEISLGKLLVFAYMIEFNKLNRHVWTSIYVHDK